MSSFPRFAGSFAKKTSRATSHVSLRSFHQSAVSLHHSALKNRHAVLGARGSCRNIGRHSHNSEFHTSAPRRDLIEDPRYTPEKIAQRAKYPVITAKDSAKSKEMPRAAKMLVRDFIDDSLYHPNYGYFSKQAVIFSPETDFEFDKIKDHMEFLSIIADKYKEIEDDMDVRDEVARQVWHTPTELFKV